MRAYLQVSLFPLIFCAATSLCNFLLGYRIHARLGDLWSTIIGSAGCSIALLSIGSPPYLLHFIGYDTPWLPYVLIVVRGR